jgi:hypothetical protein
MPYSWYPAAWSGMTFIRIVIPLCPFCLSIVPRVQPQGGYWGTLFRIMPYSASSLAVSSCDGLDRSHTVTLTEGASASMPTTATVSSNRR